jgi:hypothetical protein
VIELCGFVGVIGLVEFDVFDLLGERVRLQEIEHTKKVNSHAQVIQYGKETARTKEQVWRET